MGTEKKTTQQAYQVSLSANAVRNIDELTGYIAFINRQPANAIRVGDAIMETISRIEQHPYAFRECEFLTTRHKSYRRAVCLSWHIIYKITGKHILILGVLHQSRKPSVVKSLKRIR